MATKQLSHDNSIDVWHLVNYLKEIKLTCNNTFNWREISQLSRFFLVLLSDVIYSGLMLIVDRVNIDKFNDSFGNSMLENDCVLFIFLIVIIHIILS